MESIEHYNFQVIQKIHGDPDVPSRLFPSIAVEKNTSPIPTKPPRRGLDEKRTDKMIGIYRFWLVVSTPLKNISQNGNLPQVGMKIKTYLKPPPRVYTGLYMMQQIFGFT